MRRRRAIWFALAPANPRAGAGRSTCSLASRVASAATRAREASVQGFHVLEQRLFRVENARTGGLGHLASSPIPLTGSGPLRARSPSGPCTRTRDLAKSQHLASRSASRRSVFEPDRPAGKRIFDGAATTQLIPALAHARARPYPGRPASLHHPHRRRQRPQPGHRRLRPRRHPLRPHLNRSQHRSRCDHRPRVHISPTQLPSFITGASRNCGSTAGPIRRQPAPNLRARRRALHTLLAQPGRTSELQISLRVAPGFLLLLPVGTGRC